jgi:uncharacterized phage protein (TIGR02216 family)
MTFAEMAVRLSGQAALLLGWRPFEFWSSTPAELAAMLGAFAAPDASADQATVEKLMEQYPDAPTGGD